MNPLSDHIPVLLSQTVEILSPKPGDRVLDVTLGLGGHSRAFLERIGTGGELVGIDVDLDNLEQAKANLPTTNCQLFHENFANLQNLHLGDFDIIFADLGVSSPHFDDASRGFSFRAGGPLDMRLDRTSGSTAADLIQNSSAEQLADILFQYGEIRQSRKLAAAIKEASPQTTQDLRSVCDSFFGHRSASTLPQVFQAFRIAVNDEMGALETLLATGPSLLKPGGRLGIIAFHSLEDRLVKHTFKELTTAEIDDTTGAQIADAPYSLLTKKAIKPTEEEIERNPRARSARLRAIARRV